MWSSGIRISAARALVAAATLCGVGSSTLATEPVTLKVVGGLGALRQYTALEEPFWRDEIGRISGGRISARVHSYDRSGLRGQDMLQLMRLGVVPFGTASLGLVSGDEPMFSALDLPVLNPDFAALRRTIETFRPKLREILNDTYEIELLGIYSYPAQVIFCSKPFSGLHDLGSRKVRTSSVAQSDVITALGGIPMIVPFADMVDAMRRGTVDCAVTGTLSGYEAGLGEVSTHVHGFAVNWGISFFGANKAAWDNLPNDVRETIRTAVGTLETRIMEAAEADTELGLLCSVGSPRCPLPKRGTLTLVPASVTDEAVRRRLLDDHVLQQWFDRCGQRCELAWKEGLGPELLDQVQMTTGSSRGRRN